MVELLMAWVSDVCSDCRFGKLLLFRTMLQFRLRVVNDVLLLPDGYRCNCVDEFFFSLLQVVRPVSDLVNEISKIFLLATSLNASFLMLVSLALLCKSFGPAEIRERVQVILLYHVGVRTLTLFSLNLNELHDLP